MISTTGIMTMTNIEMTMMKMMMMTMIMMRMRAIRLGQNIMELVLRLRAMEELKRRV